MIYLTIWLIGIALTAIFYVLYELFDFFDDFRGIYTDFWYNLSDFCYHFAPVWSIVGSILVIALFVAREVFV